MVIVPGTTVLRCTLNIACNELECKWMIRGNCGINWKCWDLMTQTRKGQYWTKLFNSHYAVISASILDICLVKSGLFFVDLIILYKCEIVSVIWYNDTSKFKQVLTLSANYKKVNDLPYIFLCNSWRHVQYLGTYTILNSLIVWSHRWTIWYAWLLGAIWLCNLLWALICDHLKLASFTVPYLQRGNNLFR